MAKKEEVKVVIDSKLCIELNEKWQLTADSLNYILRRKTGGKFIIEGYYQDIEDVMNALLEKRLKESEATAINSLIKEVKQIRQAIKRFAEDIKGAAKQGNAETGKKVS